MLLLAADENVSGHLLHGLRQHHPDVDVRSVQEAGQSGREDPEVLEWAATEGRILITGDRRTMVDFAWQRIAASLPTPGVLVLSDSLSLAETAEQLALVAQCGEPEEFANRVRFLPVT